MMQPPRPAAWIAALLLVASLGFMPREGTAWTTKLITPVIDPTNEGEPDTPWKVDQAAQNMRVTGKLSWADQIVIVTPGENTQIWFWSDLRQLFQRLKGMRVSRT